MGAVLGNEQGLPNQEVAELCRETVISHLEPCPDSGTGVHTWLLSSANRLLNAGLLTDETREEIVDIIESAMTRPPQPVNEVKSAVDRTLRDDKKSENIGWLEGMISSLTGEKPSVRGFYRDKHGVFRVLTGDPS